ncbi:hypothetical protein GGTG_09441 [Gaeumannomyces tritici R3-111a-1]|uniref:Uncharacterized protein n=1 Tax=Gaeumannomyces tritici (strain R3-111a-1) TaxID=644352 RepID=J3P7F0_GAET3|nr:hypothetical protein GGTG_09441 [Gaeumannomyces tritici R3-111a-1]EJT72581.1 hypothetical protein GGTG_09441 [Gaeumannomyces tritici R3-111a-1]
MYMHVGVCECMLDLRASDCASMISLLSNSPTQHRALPQSSSYGGSVMDECVRECVWCVARTCVWPVSSSCRQSGLLVQSPSGAHASLVNRILELMGREFPAAFYSFNAAFPSSVSCEQQCATIKQRMKGDSSPTADVFGESKAQDAEMPVQESSSQQNTEVPTRDDSQQHAEIPTQEDSHHHANTLADKDEPAHLPSGDAAVRPFGVSHGADSLAWHDQQARQPHSQPATQPQHQQQQHHHRHHHHHHHQKRQQQQEPQRLPLPPQPSSYFSSSSSSDSESGGGGSSGSSSSRASYDGSSGRSFPLVTDKAKYREMEERERKREREEEEEGGKLMAGSYGGGGGGGGGCDCADDDGQKQQQQQEPGSGDGGHGDSKLGKILEKTGKVLHSERVTEAGRHRREEAGHEQH